jgi:hypothetical protein
MSKRTGWPADRPANGQGSGRQLSGSVLARWTVIAVGRARSRQQHGHTQSVVS